MGKYRDPLDNYRKQGSHANPNLSPPHPAPLFKPVTVLGIVGVISAREIKVRNSMFVIIPDPVVPIKVVVITC